MDWNHKTLQQNYYQFICWIQINIELKMLKWRWLCVVVSHQTYEEVTSSKTRVDTVKHRIMYKCVDCVNFILLWNYCEIPTVMVGLRKVVNKRMLKILCRQDKKRNCETCLQWERVSWDDDSTVSDAQNTRNQNADLSCNTATSKNLTSTTTHDYLQRKRHQLGL